MANKLAHLEMIQGVINRQAHNSFLLKGWSVTLVSAIFVLFAKDSKSIFVYLAYFPAIAFWILDGFFLSQERLFRWLYDKVRKLPENKIDFSMETSKKLRFWLGAIFSKTLIIFHGVVIVFITAVIIVSCLY